MKKLTCFKLKDGFQNNEDFKLLLQNNLISIDSFDLNFFLERIENGYNSMSTIRHYHKYKSEDSLFYNNKENCLEHEKELKEYEDNKLKEIISKEKLINFFHNDIQSICSIDYSVKYNNEYIENLIKNKDKLIDILKGL